MQAFANKTASKVTVSPTMTYNEWQLLNHVINRQKVTNNRRILSYKNKNKNYYYSNSNNDAISSGLEDIISLCETTIITRNIWQPSFPR